MRKPRKMSHTRKNKSKKPISLSDTINEHFKSVHKKIKEDEKEIEKLKNDLFSKLKGNNNVDKEY